jgi:hypothetical protein
MYGKTACLRLAASLLTLSAPPALAETARMADSFVDTIGVQTHIANSGNYTSLYSTWLNRIQTAGIRHIRDGFWTQADSNKAQSLMSTILAATGTQVRFLLTQGASCTNAFANSPASYVSWGWKAAQIDGFEGMNEIGPAQGWCGTNSNPTWYQQFVADSKYLRTTVAGMSGFTALPVVSPSLNEYGRYDPAHLNADANLIGNVTPYVTHGNWHVYCSQNAPSCTFGVFPSGMTPAFGSLPYMVTETGYTTVPGGGDGTVQQTGKYYSRLFFEWFNHGAAAVYAYELLDDTSASGGEANFGILYSDGSPKPAYTAISNEIAILKDPGPPFTPGSLNYTFSAGLPSQFHHTLLQKRDGRFYLAMWLEQNYYDSFSPVQVTVNFASTQGHINQYDPLTSATPKTAWNNVSSVTLSITDQAAILEMGASSSAPLPAASLTANPASIVSGGTSALTWNSTNATSCTGAGFSTGGATSGTVPVSPATTASYSVACTGSGGTARASTTVTVAPSAAFTVSSPANGAAVSGSVNITGAAGFQWVNVACYTSNFTKACPDITPSGGTYTLTLDTTKLPAGSNTVYVMAFSVPAGQPGGTSATVALTLDINKSPTTSLTANPASIVSGGTSALTWNSTNATSCTGAGFSTGGVTSGTVLVSPATTASYSIACTGSGGTARASTTVTVAPSAAFTVSSPANGAAVSGSVNITGAAGFQWVNVACYTSNFTKACPDITPSGGTYTLTLDTTKLPAGSNTVYVMAFSVPAGQPGGTSATVPLTLKIGN